MTGQFVNTSLWRRRLVTPVALLCMGLLGLTACSDVSSNAGSATNGGIAAHPQQPPYNVFPLLHPSHKYLGAAIPGVPESLSPVTAFAAKIGKQPNLLEYYAGWGDGFDASGVRRIDQSGSLAYMTWEPFKPSVADIANGASDPYISSFARSVRKLNLPVAISFGHEMNGSWYPWGTRTNKPADFVRAWRRIVDLFRKAGAINVIWVWSPNVTNPVPTVRLKPYYPGDAYVDWVGVTGYYGLTGARTFDGLFGPTTREVRQFTRKPFIIAETSSELIHGRSANIDDLFNGVTSRSDVLGFIWFNYVKRADWRIERSPLALAEFKKRASSDLFGFDVRKP